MEPLKLARMNGIWADRLEHYRVISARIQAAAQTKGNRPGRRSRIEANPFPPGDLDWAAAGWTDRTIPPDRCCHASANSAPVLGFGQPAQYLFDPLGKNA